MSLLKLILFFILFLFIIRLVRLIMRFWSSSKTTVDDLRNGQEQVNEKYKDVEEADFKEINFDEEEDLEKHDKSGGKSE